MTTEVNHMARNAKTATARTARTSRPPQNAIPTKVCPFLRAIGASVFEYPATAEFFYKDKSTKDGLAVWSKVGERIYNRGYNARKALAVATEAVAATKAGTKARKEANVKLAEAQAKVDAATAEGAFKYGRVKRVHGAAMATA